ncbi:hypothetical protein B0H13DRAFT_1882959 [Mycena leptocephala]|nr:hypothetical protein B0H13DRAFT_1882959 [Mycena leptocephala]
MAWSGVKSPKPEIRHALLTLNCSLLDLYGALPALLKRNQGTKINLRRQHNSNGSTPFNLLLRCEISARLAQVQLQLWRLVWRASSPSEVVSSVGRASPYSNVQFQLLSRIATPEQALAIVKVMQQHSDLLTGLSIGIRWCWPSFLSTVATAMSYAQQESTASTQDATAQAVPSERAEGPNAETTTFNAEVNLKSNVLDSATGPETVVHDSQWARVFVKNLPNSLDKEGLATTLATEFLKRGAPIRKASIRLAWDKSCCLADIFVDGANYATALKISGSVILGKTIWVEPFQPKRMRAKPQNLRPHEENRFSVDANAAELSVLQLFRILQSQGI